MSAAVRPHLVRAAPWLAVVGTALLGIAARLLFPHSDPGAEPTRPGVLCVLVDVSASVARQRPGWALEARRHVEAARLAAERDGRELAVVELATRVALTVGPCDARSAAELLRGARGEPWSPGAPAGEDLGSDLRGALALAHGLLGEEGRAPGEVWILSDGLDDRVRAGPCSPTGARRECPSAGCPCPLPSASTSPSTASAHRDGSRRGPAWPSTSRDGRAA